MKPRFLDPQLVEILEHAYQKKDASTSGFFLVSSATSGRLGRNLQQHLMEDASLTNPEQCSPTSLTKAGTTKTAVVQLTRENKSKQAAILPTA